MIQLNQIKPLTDFLRNAKAHIANLKASGQPEVLTVNGEAAVVVQDAESYQELLALATRAHDDQRLAAALEALRNGEKGTPAAEVRRKLQRKYGEA